MSVLRRVVLFVRNSRVEFERLPSRGWKLTVLCAYVVLGVGLAVAALTRHHGDDQRDALRRALSDQSCENAPEHSGCVVRAPVFAPGLQSGGTLAGPRGCDGESLARARMRTGSGGAPLANPASYVDVEYSRSWFASERDAKLFRQLMAVRPMDVGLAGLGTGHWVSSGRPAGSSAAFVTVTADCVDPSDGSTWTASVRAAIQPTAAAARRRVTEYRPSSVIRPLFGDLTRCDNSGSPRATCLVAVGRVLAIVTAPELGLAYDIAEGTAAFVAPLVLSEAKAAAAPGTTAAVRGREQSLRLYRRLAAMPPASVPLPQPYVATAVELNTLGLNPLRIDISVAGSSGEFADIHLYLHPDAAAAAEQIFYGRLEWGVDHPLCESRREQALCRARVGATAIVATVSAYGNPPVPTGAYDEARELVLAATAIVRRAASG